jgi:glyceraldehyde 3-phosphate dehydrogenase
MKGVLGYEPAPLVSSDFNHNPLSSVYCPQHSNVTAAGMVRIVSWYDNEWGFSNRMLDTTAHMATLL